MGLKTWVEDTNLRVARSPVGRWFRLENSGHVSDSMDTRMR
jgi:AGZA family xanthine/uracil permease-like MFS transporter